MAGLNLEVVSHLIKSGLDRAYAAAEIASAIGVDETLHIDVALDATADRLEVTTVNNVRGLHVIFTLKKPEKVESLKIPVTQTSSEMRRKLTEYVHKNL